MDGLSKNKQLSTQVESLTPTLPYLQKRLTSLTLNNSCLSNRGGTGSSISPNSSSRVSSKRDAFRNKLKGIQYFFRNEILMLGSFASVSSFCNLKTKESDAITPCIFKID